MKKTALIVEIDIYKWLQQHKVLKAVPSSRQKGNKDIEIDQPISTQLINGIKLADLLNTIAVEKFAQEKLIREKLQDSSQPLLMLQNWKTLTQGYQKIQVSLDQELITKMVEGEGNLINRIVESIRQQVQQLEEQQVQKKAQIKVIFSRERE